MKLKGLTDEDFVNYKKPSMFLVFPYCTFKCDKEAGCQVCQNSSLAAARILDVSLESLVARYLGNPISHAVVCGGLEPLDSFEELLELVKAFRQATQDDIINYTGYTEEEVSDKIAELQKFPNMIVKFGRFRYNDKSRYDEILGITLASENQYAKKIS